VTVIPAWSFEMYQKNGNGRKLSLDAIRMVGILATTKAVISNSDEKSFYIFTHPNKRTINALRREVVETFGNIRWKYTNVYRGGVLESYLE
jgi:hypothetical protein